MSCTLVLLEFSLAGQIHLLCKLILHAAEGCSMTWHGSGHLLAQGNYQHVACLVLYTYIPSAHSIRCNTTLVLPPIALSHADAYLQ